MLVSYDQNTQKKQHKQEKQFTSICPIASQ